MKRGRVGKQISGSAAAALLLSGLAACSFVRTGGREATVVIAFEGTDPEAASERSFSRTVGDWFGLGGRGTARAESDWLKIPSSWRSFDCLGLQISGDGITPDATAFSDASVCSGGTVSLQSAGAFGGLVSTATGGSLSLSVPVGSSRKVQLFGLKTSDGTCPSISSLLGSASTSSGGAPVLGSEGGVRSDMPFQLATTTVNLSADTSVTLTPSFSRSSAVPVLCDGTQSSVLTPTVTVTGMRVEGVSVAEIASQAAAIIEGASDGSYDIEITATLRLDRRLASAISKSNFTVVDSTLPEGYGLTISSLTAVDDYTYSVVAHLEQDLDAQGADHIEMKVDPGRIKDIYGRSVPSATVDVSSASVAYLESVGVDPTSLTPGSGGGGSGGSSDLPSIGGYYMVDGVQVFGDGTPLYLLGACSSSISYVQVNILDSAGDIFQESLPCPSPPGYSGYDDDQYLYLEAGDLAEGPMTVYLQGLDSGGWEVQGATAEYPFWVDVTPPGFSVLNSDLSSNTFSLDIGLSDFSETTDVIIEIGAYGGINSLFTSASYTASDLAGAVDSDHQLHFSQAMPTGTTDVYFSVWVSDGAMNWDWYDGVASDSGGGGGGGGGTTGGGSGLPTPVGTLAGLRSRVAFGGSFQCFIDGDSTGVKCVGEDVDGQLGRGMENDPVSFPIASERTFPAAESFSTLGTEVKRVSGVYHGCILYSGGTVKCWGINSYGVLGSQVASSEYVTSPVSISGLPANVTDIVAGHYFTCALTSLQNVYCWGWNAYGQLGTGSSTPTGDPAVVVSGSGSVDPLSNVTSISAGDSHVCAVSAGSVYCWGSNMYGQLGVSDVTEDLPGSGSSGPGSGTPVAVSLPVSGQSVAVGNSHSCALLVDGSVYCWGQNYGGQLGQGTSDAGGATPVAASGIEGNSVDVSQMAQSIVAGLSHTCALMLSDNSVKCWGANYYGQIGNGMIAGGVVSVPDTVLHEDGTPVVASQISSGWNHVCAVLEWDGSIACWGHNDQAQLGADNGFDPSISSAVFVDGASLSATRVWLTGDSSLASYDDGSVLVWGSNRDWGVLAARSPRGMTLSSATPVDGIDLVSGETIVEVSAGTSFACALTSEGNVFCWGSNATGQLGTQLAGSSSTALKVLGLEEGVESIASGAAHTCAILSGGAGVRCWGYDGSGELGDDNAVTLAGSSSASPLDVVDSSGSPITGAWQLSAAGASTCGVMGDTLVWCWGSGSYGSGEWPNSLRAVPVPAGNGGSALSGAVEVQVGIQWACARMDTGLVQCWGGNGYGPTYGFAQVVEGIANVSSLGLGRYHACAVVGSGTDSTIWCWGVNYYGQVGEGVFSSENEAYPVAVTGGLSGPARILAGNYSTCADYGDGDVLCWGYNDWGSLGTGDSSSRAEPTWVQW